MNHSNTLPHINAERWFWVASFVFLFAWVIVPTLVRHHIPLDSLETVTWGRELAWGYDRNPYFNAWLPRFFTVLTQHSDWGIYLLARLSVFVGIWSVWRLAREMVSPTHALVAALLLTGTMYYTEAAVDVSDNVLSVGLWGLTTYFFYMAVKYQQTRYWLALGLFAGLALMVKYLILLLFFCMGLFLLTDKKHYVIFKTKGIYLAILVFLAIVLPHSIWLFQHDFVTLGWATDRIEATAWTGYTTNLVNKHLIDPFFFLLQVLGNVIGGLVLFLFTLNKRQSYSAETNTLTQFDHRFLAWTALGPFIMMMLIGIIAGKFLYTRWVLPLPLFWGLCLVAWIKPQITLKSLRRFFVIGSVLFILILTAYGYFYAATKRGQDFRAFYPGKEIAYYVDSTWAERFNNSLPIVVGERWTAGSIAFYSTADPIIYIEDNPKWLFTDDDNIRQQGALFVWEPGQNAQLTAWQQRFPALKINNIETKTFPWASDLVDKSVTLNFAYLPPTQ